MVRDPADEREAEILRRAMRPGGFSEIVDWEDCPGDDWTWADWAHALGLIGDD